MKDQSTVSSLTMASPLAVTTQNLEAPSERTSLEIRWPEIRPAGEHRFEGFADNQVIAWYHHPGGTRTPNLKDDGLCHSETLRTGQRRLGSFRLTVDLTPRSTIWLTKAGVLVEKREFMFGVPGVVGVVSADDLPTDLSGSQFVLGKKFDDLQEWTKTCCQQLLIGGPDRAYPLTPQKTVSDFFSTQVVQTLVFAFFFNLVVFAYFFKFLEAQGLTGDGVVVIVIMSVSVAMLLTLACWRYARKLANLEARERQVEKLLSQLKAQGHRL